MSSQLIRDTYLRVGFLLVRAAGAGLVPPVVSHSFVLDFFTGLCETSSKALHRSSCTRSIQLHDSRDDNWMIWDVKEHYRSWAKRTRIGKNFLNFQSSCSRKAGRSLKLQSRCSRTAQDHSHLTTASHRFHGHRYQKKYLEHRTVNLKCTIRLSIASAKVIKPFQPSSSPSKLKDLHWKFREKIFNSIHQFNMAC